MLLVRVEGFRSKSAWRASKIKLADGLTEFFQRWAEARQAMERSKSAHGDECERSKSMVRRGGEWWSIEGRQLAAQTRCQVE